MKLTYRGITYKVKTPEVQPQQLKPTVGLNKHFTNLDRDRDKIILVRPIHYYTYRGVSYTKNLIFDSYSKLLLDIDRQ